ncbi:MAG: hypothetical protein L6Q40_07990 [Azonexus sp.]|nr:hypothetical protein [Azonexus sp.]
MRRAVYLAGRGIACARGLSPDAVAEALWQGGYAPANACAATLDHPYFSIATLQGNWRQRAEAAVRHVAATLGPLAPETPLFFASSSFQIGEFEALPAPRNLPIACASPSLTLAEWLGLNGPCHSYATACTSGNAALMAASEQIADGLIDEAVVLGFELANRSTLAGFIAMGLLSPDLGRPFDQARNGLLLGEAVAAVRLSAHHGDWQLRAQTMGLDAHTLTGPTPDGSRIAALAVDCLTQVNLAAADLDLVKVHAGGSPASDLAEARALHTLFGADLPPLLSLKPALGHTLGASTIAELVALTACLDAGHLPGTAAFSHTDPEIGLQAQVDRKLLNARHALLLALGFGGGMGALVLSRRCALP